MAGPLEILSVGRPLRGPWAELAARYETRARRYAPITLTRLKPSAARRPGERRRAEAGELLARLPRAGVAVALDAEGRAVDSPGFAKRIDSWRERGGATFIVGGADGLARQVVDSCGATLSFGPMTLSHDLALLVLLEQLYRALAGSAGHPYSRH